jgi:hypothetical protein
VPHQGQPLLGDASFDLVIEQNKLLVILDQADVRFVDVAGDRRDACEVYQVEFVRVDRLRLRFFYEHFWGYLGPEVCNFFRENLKKKLIELKLLYQKWIPGILEKT